MSPNAPNAPLVLTELERDALRAILFSDYQDSDQLDDIILNPVWSEASSLSDGGVYASLLKKGLIGVQTHGPRREHEVWLTPAARPYAEALLNG